MVSWNHLAIVAVLLIGVLCAFFVAEEYAEKARKNVWAILRPEKLYIRIGFLVMLVLLVTLVACWATYLILF